MLFLAETSTSQVHSTPQVCTNIDLRHTLPPVRDQGESGWCFAYTTADLVSQKLKFSVSAYDIAVTFFLGQQKELLYHPDLRIQHYLKQQNPGFFRTLFKLRMAEPINYSRKRFFSPDGYFNIGGDEEYALMMMNIRPVCTERSLSSEMTQRMQSDLARLQKEWKKRYKSYRELPTHLEHVGAILDPVVRYQATMIQDSVNKVCERVKSPALIPRMIKVASSIEEYDAKVKAGLNPRGVREYLLKEINSQLSQGKAVAFGYSAYDFIENSTLNPPPPQLAHVIDRGDHSSLITARKWVNNQCLYFVRNTWGQDCSIYKKEYQTACEKHHGGIWVTSEDFKSIYSVFSVQ